MKREKNYEINSLDLQRQQEIIEEVSHKNKELYRTTGRQKKVMIVTYGCQMNAVRCI
ncbi:hypothetical protein [Clostridium formicaceticum]|uniref:Uncharacterized protein n=1 Tax=Clostridium formicaceticum TaxID=1497 RepID=A0AAC9WHJ8_9CLOT|nr:hypothetical protein [Clostridium formicaceticum]ARE87765.1 hypothetical protein CLFO_21650 [Clostridium formicaceticum]